MTYSYTDIDVLSVGGKLEFPRSSFLQARSPEHLLALCGLHSRIEPPWRLQLRKLLALGHPGAPGTQYPILEETLRTNIKKYLRELSEKDPES